MKTTTTTGKSKMPVSANTGIETTEKQVNQKYVNAISIAEKIMSVMGPDYFTIEQMRKKMVITDNSMPKKLSWSVCNGYLTSIANYGLAEQLINVKNCFRIQLDTHFRISYFDRQIDIRNEEIKEYKELMQEIFDKDKAPKAQTETAKPATKKAVVKKTVIKKLRK